MTFRPTFWPTVFTVPAVLLMLGLTRTRDPAKLQEMFFTY